MNKEGRLIYEQQHCFPVEDLVYGTFKTNEKERSVLVLQGEGVLSNFQWLRFTRRVWERELN